MRNQQSKFHHRMSHYSFQAVSLLEQCRTSLQRLLQEEAPRRRSRSLSKLSNSLDTIDRVLLSYLRHFTESALSENGDSLLTLHELTEEPQTSIRAMAMLKQLLHEREQANPKDDLHNPQDPLHHTRGDNNSLYGNASTKTAVDTLMFRLIVSLELLLVRIDDAYYVLLGHRMDQEPLFFEGIFHTNRNMFTTSLLMLGLCSSVGYFARNNHRLTSSVSQSRTWLLFVAKGAGLAFAGLRLMNGVARVWMRDKIVRSTQDLNEWTEQWELIHRQSGFTSLVELRSKQNLSSKSYDEKNTTADKRMNDLLGLDDQSRTLIEHAMRQGRKTYFWRSTGEIRFLMLKRFMDVYYASVGTAISNKHTSALALPLVTGAAASFYSLTGVSQEALSSVINDSSLDLIKHAWGMVSLPALKTLMLQVTRLMKGMAVAERITICGVPCMVLSKDPVPEMAASIPPNSKCRTGSSATLAQLPTIQETETHSQEEDANFGAQAFAGRDKEFRQRDVILHLTGGGFFAHTIASDLPFLMEWSAKTGSIVICPEYALLPENYFPTALNQVTTIYEELAGGRTGPTLGFEVNNICVTGESAGGNLAAALCVHLSQALNKKMTASPQESPQRSERMPDGLMLSCPALNLTNQLSLSRFLGDKDPVLPHSLISLISDAYLPPEVGCDKKNPLASPMFAPDSLLQYFPPTLLFTSSNDPLLDDSVVFNEKLCALGINSDVVASHNVPHAYLGLGTAGFPEAVQVQNHAMRWLTHVLQS